MPLSDALADAGGLPPWPPPDDAGVAAALAAGAPSPQAAPMASYAPPAAPPVSAIPPMSFNESAAAAPPPRPVPYPGAPPGAPPGPGAPPALGLLPGTGGPRAAGFVPSTQQTTTKQALAYSPDTVGAIGEDLGARKELTLAQASAEGARGAAQRGADTILGGHDVATAIAQRTRQAQQMSELHNYHRNIQTLQQDAALDTENPHKWFDDKSTFDKISTGLGLSLMAAAGAYGVHLDPVGWVNGQIKSSVEAQRAAHSKKQEKITGMLNSYGLLKEQFGDDEKATLASEYVQRQALVADLGRKVADTTAAPETRLRTAQVQAALAKDNASTLRELDEKQAVSIEEVGSQKYQQAVSAGGGQVGITVTFDGGKKVVIPMEKALELQKLGILPATGLEARKTEAEIGKTEAETAKLKAAQTAANPVDTAVAAGQSLKSTAAVSDPLASISQHFQGTEGAHTAMDREAINATIMGEMHKLYGARTPEAQRELAKPYLIESGDRPDTIQYKVQNLRKFVGGKAPYSPGAGAEEE